LINNIFELNPLTLPSPPGERARVRGNNKYLIDLPASPSEGLGQVGTILLSGK